MDRLYGTEELYSLVTVLKACKVGWGVSHQLKIREDLGPGVFSYG